MVTDNDFSPNSSNIVYFISIYPKGYDIPLSGGGGLCPKNKGFELLYIILLKDNFSIHYCTQLKKMLFWPLLQVNWL